MGNNTQFYTNKTKTATQQTITGVVQLKINLFNILTILLCILLSCACLSIPSCHLIHTV